MLLVSGAVIGAANQHGGTQIVSQPVLLGMVPFGTTGCVPRSRTRGSAQFGNSSIAQSVQQDGISGSSGKIMSPSFQHTIHGLLHRQFDELLSVTPIPAKLSVFSGLTFQTLLQGTIQWHIGGSTSCQSGRVRMGRLMRRSSKS